jgi:ABC-2 type transport system permease protein
MQPFFTLTRRELGAYFFSLTGYVIITVALFLIGLSFYTIVAKLQAESTPLPITELFYSTPFFWLVLLLSAPIITMRVFSLEHSTGTFETLMTTPISDWQVVMAKFTASLIFYMVMWLPLLGCLGAIRYVTRDASSLDPNIAGTTFLGIFLLGCLYMSMGCFASSVTKSQMIAAMLSLAIGLSLFILTFLGEQLPMERGWAVATLNHMSMLEHMQDFARGVIDTRAVIYYLSATGFFLFLTYRVVESRRWK